MSIVSAFNNIAVEQGGPADTSGTIIGAIDALNDALAGSDQERASSIEEAVTLLGGNIGGSAAQDIRIGYTIDTDSNQSIAVIEGDTYCVQGTIATEEGNISTFVPDESVQGYIDKAEIGSVIFFDKDSFENMLKGFEPALKRTSATYYYGVPPVSWLSPYVGNLIVVPNASDGDVSQGCPVIDQPIFIFVEVITTQDM